MTLLQTSLQIVTSEATTPVITAGKVQIHHNSKTLNLSTVADSTIGREIKSFKTKGIHRTRLLATSMAKLLTSMIGTRLETALVGEVVVVADTNITIVLTAMVAIRATREIKVVIIQAGTKTTATQAEIRLKEVVVAQEPMPRWSLITESCMMKSLIALRSTTPTGLTCNATSSSMCVSMNTSSSPHNL